MGDLGALAQVKESLLLAWDGGGRNESLAEEAGARFESLDAPRRPRGGLAVGHSFDPDTGEPRIELRVNARSGPNYRKAEQLAKLAEAAGFEAFLMFSTRPRIDPLPAPSPKLPGLCKPLHIGASIGHQESGAGTLGAFVRLSDGAAGIVSCGHVLARRRPQAAVSKRKRWGALADSVHQPGWPDQNPIIATTRIASLHDFAPFVGDQPTNLDAAVALLDDNIVNDGNVVPDLPFVPPEFRKRQIGHPLSSGDLKTGVRVAKLGRTTGFTRATVSAVSFAGVRVDFATPKSVETFTFFEVHEIAWDAGWEDDETKRYSSNGDSGSLVMTEDGLRPIGLHFTSADVAGGRASYVVPWDKIAATFHVGLLE